MKYVEIYKIKQNAQVVLATFSLNGSVIECQGDKNFCESITSSGIQNYSEGEGATLYPKDGELFLSQLQNNFKSGYLMASGILEK